MISKPRAQTFPQHLFQDRFDPVLPSPTPARENRKPGVQGKGNHIGKWTPYGSHFPVAVHGVKVCSRTVRLQTFIPSSGPGKRAQFRDHVLGACAPNLSRSWGPIRSLCFSVYVQCHPASEPRAGPAAGFPPTPSPPLLLLFRLPCPRPVRKESGTKGMTAGKNHAC